MVSDNFLTLLITNFLLLQIQTSVSSFFGLLLSFILNKCSLDYSKSYHVESYLRKSRCWYFGSYKTENQYKDDSTKVELLSNNGLFVTTFEYSIMICYVSYVRDNNMQATGASYPQVELISVFGSLEKMRKFTSFCASENAPEKKVTEIQEDPIGSGYWSKSNTKEIRSFDSVILPLSKDGKTNLGEEVYAECVSFLKSKDW